MLRCMYLLYSLMFWESTPLIWECCSDHGAKSRGGHQQPEDRTRVCCKQTDQPLGTWSLADAMLPEVIGVGDGAMRPCSKATIRESQGGHLGCGAKTYHRMETTYHLLELLACYWASEKENWVRSISWPCSHSSSSWALWDMPSLKVGCA